MPYAFFFFVYISKVPPTWLLALSPPSRRASFFFPSLSLELLHLIFFSGASDVSVTCVIYDLRTIASSPRSPGCRRGGTLYYSVIFPLGPLSFCAAAAAVARREGSVESLFWACCTALVVGTEKCIIVDSCFFQICSALSGCVVFLPPPQFLKFNPSPST